MFAGLTGFFGSFFRFLPRSALGLPPGGGGGPGIYEASKPPGLAAASSSSESSSEESSSESSSESESALAVTEAPGTGGNGLPPLAELATTSSPSLKASPTL